MADEAATEPAITDLTDVDDTVTDDTDVDERPADHTSTDRTADDRLADGQPRDDRSTAERSSEDRSAAGGAGVERPAAGRLGDEYTSIHTAAATLFDESSRSAVRERATAIVTDQLGHDAVGWYRLTATGLAATHTTARFDRLGVPATFERTPTSLRAVTELRRPHRSEPERFPAVDAWCVAPTGAGELIVCPFESGSTADDRFLTHLNELASVAGTAMERARTDETVTERTKTDGEVTNEATTQQVTDDEPEADAHAARARSVFDALNRAFPDYAFLHDAEGEYLDVLLGERTVGENSRERIVGSTVHDQLTEAAADRVLAAIQRAIAQDTAVTVEYPFETGGETRYYEGVVTALSDSQAGAVLVARDVTRRREQREQLRRRNQQLERIASILSHDLQTPLNTAQGYLRLAREEVETPADEADASDEAGTADDGQSTHGDDSADRIDRTQVASYLATIDNAIDRMIDISDGVSTLVHHETTELETGPVTLSTVARESWEVADTMAEVGGESGSDATSNSADEGESSAGPQLAVAESLAIRGNRSALRHVFENLFSNATEYAGSGVTVRVGECDGGFYVADDGPGVPEQVRDSLFEAGESASGSTGIGLAVVRTVAEAHDWEVTVTDSEHGGARFEFTGVETV